MSFMSWVSSAVGEIMERRKHGSDRLTISEILDRMQSMADRSYDGNLQDNSLSVFNRLSADNKRTFLRRALMMMWAAQIDLARSGLQEVIIEDEMRIEPAKVAKERTEIENEIHLEQVRLTSKLKKAFFWICVVVSLVIGGTLFFASPVDNSAKTEELSMYQRITRVIDLLLQLKS